MEAVGLEAQLCFESVLMDLVYFWLRLNSFPNGQCSREYGASLLMESPSPSHLHSLNLGFALRTAFDFVSSTWTREGPAVLLEKSECLASGSPQ